MKIIERIIKKKLKANITGKMKREKYKRYLENIITTTFGN